MTSFQSELLISTNIYQFGFCNRVALEVFHETGKLYYY
jgi:hypothetical protein